LDWNSIQTDFISCTDNNSNVYLLEALSGNIFVLNSNGDLVNKIKIRDFQEAQDICVNAKGMLFVHKIPTKHDYYFVNVYDSKGYVKSLIPADRKYNEFYSNCGIDGEVCALENGDVIESNAYSYMINRINPDLSTTSFGKEEPFFKNLEPESNKSTAKELLFEKYQNRTVVFPFVKFSKGKKIFRLLYNYHSGSNPQTEKYYQIFSTDGNYISSGRHESWPNRFLLYKNRIGLIPDYSSNGKECRYKIVKYKYKE